MCPQPEQVLLDGYQRSATMSSQPYQGLVRPPQRGLRVLQRFQPLHHVQHADVGVRDHGQRLDAEVETGRFAVSASG
jgi:hypothetical protein